MLLKEEDERWGYIIVVGLGCRIKEWQMIIGWCCSCSHIGFLFHFGCCSFVDGLCVRLALGFKVGNIEGVVVGLNVGI